VGRQMDGSAIEATEAYWLRIGNVAAVRRMMASKLARVVGSGRGGADSTEGQLARETTKQALVVPGGRCQCQCQ
jgi:hypothetical protein